MFKSKQKQELELLTGMLHDLMRRNEGLVISLRDTTRERDDWRAKFELALHTPEYKADTEAAFKRGFENARAKFKAWLYTAADQLESDDNND